MFPNHINKVMRGQRSGATLMNLRLFAGVMLASLFTVSAGSVHAVASYSDSWLVGSNPVSGTYNEGSAIEASFSVVGSGVTRIAYNYRWSAIHEVEVETTITSRRGRRITAIGAGAPHSNYGFMMARAEAVLGWDSRDLGRYTVRSRHYSECPEVEFGTTFGDVIVGVSVSCYELISFVPAINTARLRRIEPCNTRCGDTGDIVTFRYLGSPPQRVVRGEPYTRYGNYTICGRIGTNPKRVDACSCGNVEVDITPILF